MMAVLSRTVHRETTGSLLDTGKDRHVVVSVDPQLGLVSFRLKGTRRTYGLPATYLYMHALQKNVALEKARKVKAGKRRTQVNRGTLRI